MVFLDNFMVNDEERFFSKRLDEELLMGMANTKGFSLQGRGDSQKPYRTQ